MGVRKNLFIDKIRNIIKDTDPNAIGILYGSRATGKAKKNSDWDILILLDTNYVSLKDEQMFRHNLYDLELETGEPISTFVYSTKDWNTKLSLSPLFHEVQKHGVVL